MNVMRVRVPCHARQPVGWGRLMVVALTLLLCTPVQAQTSADAGLSAAQTALQALNANELPKANRAIAQALKAAPNEALWWELAALIAERGRQIPEAQRAWQQAVSHAPENLRLAMGQAGFECRQQMAPLGVQHFSQMAVRFSDTAATAWLAAAQCAERAKLYARAKTAYAHVLDHLNNDSDALLGLSRLALREQRYDEAATTLERLLTSTETPPEEALVLMIQVQRAQDHPAMVIRYEADLLKQFPDSKALSSLTRPGAKP
jgi:Tfp pilus assembly protein PilF